MPKTSCKLADYPSLQTYLTEELVATIAVPIDELGTIHSAALRYYHTADPLVLYFVTNKNTEKCRLLNQNSDIPAAAVVGTVRGVPFTLQMRGRLKLADARQNVAVTDKYYEKRGNRHDDIDDPSTVLLAFTPSWARFTDYSKGYEQHFLKI